VEKSLQKVQKTLDKREELWKIKQKEVLKRKIEKSQETGRKIEEKYLTLLRACKACGGPCLSQGEVQNALKIYGTDEKSVKKILKQEISYRKLHCPQDVIERPALYKLNKLSIQQLTNNLMCLVSTEYTEALLMPDEDEVVDQIKLLFAK
jgi:hypothetical protein